MHTIREDPSLNSPSLKSHCRKLEIPLPHPKSGANKLVGGERGDGGGPKMNFKWIWYDDVVTEEQKESAPKQEPNPLEARLAALEAEMKRVIKPKPQENTSNYFAVISWAAPTLEQRIQTLEDAKKPRCKTCKKIK